MTHKITNIIQQIKKSWYYYANIGKEQLRFFQKQNRYITKTMALLKRILIKKSNQRYHLMSETLIKRYKALSNTNIYKKTLRTLQLLLQKLGTLHEKTLVATIVKVIFLFRKYKKYK